MKEIKDILRSSRRSHFTIIAKTLQSAQSGADVKKLILKVRTNTVTIKKFLSICLKAGLLKVDFKKYKTTKKGLVFINKYNTLEEILRT